jgi:acetyl-CoA carboxylase biotin carboxyl carrier protein
MEISIDEIADLLEAINKLDCASVEVTVGEVSIVVRRGAALDTPVASTAAAGPIAALEARSSVKSVPSLPAPYLPTPPIAAPKIDTAVWLEQEAQGTVFVVRAPMIGTFYSAKAPGEPSFVELGTSVQQGDTLGLMEVMKLFNSLVAQAAGTVEAIFACNGDMVEFDQPVFAIRTT